VTVLRVGVGLLVGALLLAGCGGDASGGTGAPPVPADGALAVSLGTQVEAGPEAAPERVADHRGVVTGDLVRTDPTGLAELRFPDRSLTRLASTEQMTMTELTAAAVQRTRQRLTVGQTWHKVSAITAPGGTYEVATPVGVAAVRGTAFGLSCVAGPSCTLTVLEGKVAFTPTGKDPVLVSAFQTLTVTPAGAGSVATITADAVRRDAWLAKNVERDGLGGLLEPAPGSDRTVRNYRGTETTSSGARPRSVTLDCTDPSGCQLFYPASFAGQVVLVEAGGGTYRISRPSSGEQCGDATSEHFRQPLEGTAVVQGDTLTLHVESPESRQTCPDGITSTFPARVTDFTGTRVR
jgi:hypothetical protein